jgi:hypothetical protein
LGLFREHANFAESIIVAFLESDEGGRGLAFETELGAEFGPIELEGGGALRGFC